MSRVGKKVVAIPAGVTANVDGQTVKVKGPKGSLQLVLHGDITAKVEAGGIKVDPRNDNKFARAVWGTSRALVANSIRSGYLSKTPCMASHRSSVLRTASAPG